MSYLPEMTARPSGPERSVLLFVLRRAVPQTECLVGEDADGGLSPRVVSVSVDETESDAIRGAVARTIAPRVYASGSPPVFMDGESANAFVAIVEGTEEAGMWTPLADAVDRFASRDLRRAAAEVLARFVKRAPDEALRLF